MKILNRTAIALLPVTLALSACASDRSYGLSPSIEVTDLTELPAPTGGNFYSIGPQTELEIQVAGSELFSGKYATDELGRVYLPPFGYLDFAGKSPNEAAELLVGLLQDDYLVDPQVRVVPEELPLPSISVGGQVEKPGNYPALGRHSLLRAINQAGGMSEFAKTDDILIMREVDGRQYIGAFSMAAIQRGNYADPALYPNDIVMVGESPARQRLQTVLQFVPLLSTAAIIFDRVGR